MHVECNDITSGGDWGTNLCIETIGKTSISIPWRVPELCSLLRLWRNGVKLQAIHLILVYGAWKSDEVKARTRRIRCNRYHACTIHCAKQSQVLSHFSYWFLSKLCRRWGTLHKCSLSKCNSPASSHCVSVTSHNTPWACVCMSSVMGVTWIKLEPPGSSPRASISSLRHGITLVCIHFGQLPYSVHGCHKLTVYPLML